MKKWYLEFCNSVPDSLFLSTLVGCLILGSIPALGFVVLVISGLDTEGIIAGVVIVVITAIGGGVGGMACYFTRTIRKKSGWGSYLSWIVIMEAYIITVTLCMFVVDALCPYLRDETFEDIFYRGIFHLFLHIYGLFLATASFGIFLLQKFIRKKITVNRVNDKRKQ